MKICPVGTELFHAGGRTDMMKLRVAFRNFANAPKITHFWDVLVDICQRFPWEDGCS